jgi:hypothetical protein
MLLALPLPHYSGIVCTQSTVQRVRSSVRTMQISNKGSTRGIKANDAWANMRQSRSDAQYVLCTSVVGWSRLASPSLHISLKHVKNVKMTEGKPVEGLGVSEGALWRGAGRATMTSPFIPICHWTSIHVAVRSNSHRFTFRVHCDRRLHMGYWQ